MDPPPTTKQSFPRAMFRYQGPTLVARNRSLCICRHPREERGGLKETIPHHFLIIAKMVIFVKCFSLLCNLFRWIILGEGQIIGEAILTLLL